jgi:hypothetical protein
VNFLLFIFIFQFPTFLAMREGEDYWLLEIKNNIQSNKSVTCISINTASLPLKVGT